jgi:putative acetyltransferase
MRNYGFEGGDAGECRSRHYRRRRKTRAVGASIRLVKYHVTMKAIHRLATLADANRLFELRRQSIITLASKRMSVVEAETWAATLTVSGMEQKICELEIWVAEMSDTVVGWGAIRGDHLEGLCTHPEFVGRGIGTGLLVFLEGLMRGRGFTVVSAEASSNAEAFYFQRGYEPNGLRTPNWAQPIRKRLS